MQIFKSSAFLFYPLPTTISSPPPHPPPILSPLVLPPTSNLPPPTFLVLLLTEIRQPVTKLTDMAGLGLGLWWPGWRQRLGGQNNNKKSQRQTVKAKVRRQSRNQCSVWAAIVSVGSLFLQCFLDLVGRRAWHNRRFKQ